MAGDEEKLETLKQVQGFLMGSHLMARQLPDLHLTDSVGRMIAVNTVLSYHDAVGWAITRLRETKLR